MSTLELPALPGDQDNYGQFKEALLAIHQVAAPECDPGFGEGAMRHANADGSYYYFPHPDDREEILTSARELSAGSDGVQGTLIIPVAILATHPFDGSGRTSRLYHAMLSGKSPAEIEGLNICGSHNGLNTDLQAQEVIDLRPPEALLPYIHEYVYESASVDKQVDLQQGFAVLDEGVEEYKDTQSHLPEDEQRDLDEAFTVSPFAGEFYVGIDDPASLEFALNAQRPKLGNEDLPEGAAGLVMAMTRLGKDGLKQFVDDMWRFRRLRALANIACLDYATLGSRVISTPDHEVPLTITDHYIRLTNNLIQGQALV